MNEKQFRAAIQHIASQRERIGALEVLLNIGTLYAKHGSQRVAEYIFRKCMDRFPQNFRAHWELALLQERSGNIAYCKDLYNEVYEKVHFDGAARKLAELYSAEGDADSAIVWLGRVKKPDAKVRTALIRAYNYKCDMEAVATIVHQNGLFSGEMLSSFVPESETAIENFYQRYERCLDQLEVGGKTFTLEELAYQYPIPFLFRFSYYNRNNVSLFSKQCAVFRRICPELNYRSPDIDKRHPGDKIRVGFISHHFKNHSVARDRCGIIANLDRNKFHVTTIFLEPPVDTLGKFIWNHSDSQLLLHGRAERSIASWRTAIEKLELDVLVYCDIGMSLDTYFLAFSRLASVQCNTWGHSDTSGIDTIDWYISSELYEIDDECRNHYTERLLLTKSLCTYYINHTVKLTQHHSIKDIGEKYWLNNRENNIYFSLQTVNKFHPFMDEVYRRILESDSRAIVVLSFVPPPVRKEFYRRISGRIGPNISRLVVIPEQLSVNDFLALIRFSKLILDSHPFGGCNSCFEAFSLGKCVVTFPSAFISGRFTYGMYKKMGIDELITTSTDEYVGKALEIAHNDPKREALEQKILERSHLLFEDDMSLSEWNNVLVHMAAPAVRDP